MIRQLVPLFLLFLTTACNNGYKSSFLQVLEQQTLQTANIDLPVCRDKLNYAPDISHPDHTPVKYIRINFHIMLNADGSGNFDEKAAKPFLLEVLDAANNKLTRNTQMQLPVGNNTPLLPMRYQYKLTPRPGDPADDGIYFHYDDSLYYMLAGGPDQNNFDQAVYRKYGVQKDTVLNVFVMGIHVDSLVSKTYRPGSKGVGFGDWAKVADWYYEAMDTDPVTGQTKVPKDKWHYQRLLHHEIGHCLGLAHTWRSNDGCDDTPMHPNCWNKTDSPPCDSLWSNNFMDTNAHSSAWSPCQIATIHYNFQNRKQTRDMLEPRWCELDTAKTIHIATNIRWLSAKDIEGNLIIPPGGILELYCQLSIPENGRITIFPGGRLILHDAKIYNDCGRNWKGIELLSRKGEQGEVILYGNSTIENTDHEVNIKLIQ